MKLSDSVKTLPGVGDVLSNKLAQANISTVADCIHTLPRVYDDYSQVTPISQLRPGPVSIEATIQSISGRYVRRGMHITEAIAQDDSGSVRIVWFNQSYRSRQFKAGDKYFLSGEYKLSRQRFTLMNPAAEASSNFPINTARIVPKYREVHGITSRELRKIIKATLPLIDSLEETLPNWLIKQQSLMSRSAALKQLHFPDSVDKLSEAKQRYGFEEVFELTLAALLNKEAFRRDESSKIPFKPELAKSFVDKLPFNLTDSQRRAVWQIYQDMQRNEPMNRLLEGDVGSGKTVVACMAALMAISSGYQVAFMAPTELLAQQHFATINTLLKPLGYRNEVALLTGSLSASKKTEVQKHIAAGKKQFIVGTHALITENVSMQHLGLVIVDEQHRFGVDQRKKLQQKAGHMPHVLHMTATPIPRSLALTVYGELDISLLIDKPAERSTVSTQLISAKGKEQMYRDVLKQLAAGRQAFVVCPLVEPSESLPVPSATTMYEALKQGVFSKYTVGLLHGKQKPADKEATMQAYLRKEIDVLVATTVVEVGVDVPNATVMIIEGAERFGLAQLHQLRGRVGRSEHQAYCYLVMSQNVSPSRRLRALESSNDGFRLAELDLELRGPGSLYSTLQHGALDLRVASLTDTELIAAARNAAREFIDKQEDLLQYPELRGRVERLRTITNLH
jgi:ATP-dependent DNA helicase RecG